MKNINSLLHLDHRICKVQKLLSCFATWLSRQIFGHHQMMEALKSDRQPLLSHTVDNLNKKGCNVKFFMSISIQIQIQWKNNNVKWTCTRQMFISKVKSNFKWICTSQTFQWNFDFSSNIVLLVVLFSLKNNFFLFDFKTANLKLTWFQVSLVSDLLFC